MTKKNKIDARRCEPTYKAYRFTSPAHETKIVFAAGTWSAVGVLLQWRARKGMGEVPFTLDPTWASGLIGVGRAHIDDARSRCPEPSLGTRYRADTGWVIAPPMGERNDPYQ